MKLNDTIANLKLRFPRLNSEDIRELVTLMAINNDKVFRKILQAKLAGWNK